LASVEPQLVCFCRTIPGQFHDYQIHFMRQHFGSPSKAVHFADHTKLPFLLQNLAPESCHEERRTGVLSEENRIARTTSNPRALGRQSDATVGTDRPASERVPEHPAREGAEEFLAAGCQVPGTCCASELEPPLALPAFVSDKITVPMREQIGGRYEQE